MIGLRCSAALALLGVLGCKSEPRADVATGGATSTAQTVGGSPNSSAGGTSSTTTGAATSSGGARTTAGSSESSGAGGQNTTSTTETTGNLTAGAGGAFAGAGGTSGTGLRLPEANAPFDYQLGGAYAPPQSVRVVTRDREEQPAAGLYNICYVNGFQTQPQDNDRWLSDHAELILHDADGEPFLDEDWGEYPFDTSSTEKQLALVEIVSSWIEGCAVSGFDAVEIDNLDSYSRSDGLLAEDANVSFMSRLSNIAHGRGLAIGQKNAAELVPRAADLGTDFAIAEKCNRYDECDTYTEHYGNLVFVIEYRRQDFDAGCAAFPELSLVLRDLDLSTPAAGAYVYDGC